MPVESLSKGTTLQATRSAQDCQSVPENIATACRQQKDLSINPANHAIQTCCHCFHSAYLTPMSTAMKREHIGSAICQSNIWISPDEMMTPTLPSVSARICKNTPVSIWMTEQTEQHKCVFANICLVWVTKGKGALQDIHIWFWHNQKTSNLVRMELITNAVWPVASYLQKFCFVTLWFLLAGGHHSTLHPNLDNVQDKTLDPDQARSQTASWLWHCAVWLNPDSLVVVTLHHCTVGLNPDSTTTLTTLHCQTHPVHACAHDCCDYDCDYGHGHDDQSVSGHGCLTHGNVHVL